MQNYLEEELVVKVKTYVALNMQYRNITEYLLLDFVLMVGIHITNDQYVKENSKSKVGRGDLFLCDNGSCSMKMHFSLPLLFPCSFCTVVLHHPILFDVQS